MTFSSRWLLAFRLGGATVAPLPHCPACHVVFNHSSRLLSQNLPHAGRHAFKRQQYLKSNKTWEMTLFFLPPRPLSSCSPLLTRYNNPLLSSPGVKLDLGSVKRLRVWPSPGVACHIQLWAPNRKALVTPGLLFWLVNQHRKLVRRLVFLLLC